jgi:23S rRNA (adenine2503-C2)-methyltransferase
MDLQLLESRLAEAGEPHFRAGQVWEWTARGVESYADMTNLPVELRERLPDEVPFSTLELDQEALAKDGTEKALFRTADARPV